MKKNYIFSLVALLLLSVGGVKAQETSTAELKHTASVSWGANADPANGEFKPNTVDSEAEYYNNNKATTGANDWNGVAFAEFSLDVPEGATITGATLTWTTITGGRANSERSNEVYYLTAGTTLDYDDILKNRNALLYSDSRTLIADYKGQNTFEGNLDVTDAVKTILTASESTIIFQWTANAAGATLAGKASENAPKLVIEYLTGASEVDLALMDLLKAIDAAQAKADAYIVGEGLFQYAESEIAPLTDAIATAQAAYDAAESAETVKAAIDALNAAVEAFAPTMIVPSPTQAYTLSLATAGGLYLNTDHEEGVTIEEEGTPIYFVAQENGTYAIYNGEEYVNYKGNNTWDIAVSTEAYGWTIAALADGGLTINGKNGLLGTGDNKGANGDTPGVFCYGDKKTTNGHYIWTATEVAGDDDEGDTGDDDEPEIAGTSYEGIIEQTLTTPDGASMGLPPTTDDQTIIIAEAGDGLVDITYAGFTFPLPITTLPEFTIKGVTATTATDGSISYAINDYTLEVPTSNGGTARYIVTINGVQADAEAVPTIKLTLQANYINTVYFGADQAAIDAYKEAENAPADPEPANAADIAGVYDGTAATDTQMGGSSAATGEEDMTVTISAADADVIGLGNVTFSNFKIPAMNRETGDIIVSNVDVTVDNAGTYTLNASDFTVSMSMGMMTANYVGTLDGTIDAEGNADITLTLQQGPAVAIIAHFTGKFNEELTTAISNIATEAVKANGKYLEDGKVVIYRNGAKYNVNGAAIK